MIEIEREEKGKDGRWAWRVRGSPVEGRSNQPLLDACRVLKSMGERPDTEIRVFRPGRTVWDLRTTIGHGANIKVLDAPTGSPRFIKFNNPQFHQFKQQLKE